MINVNDTWVDRETGEEVLIMRVADIYVLYQNAKGDMANRHPMIFLQDFINLEGMERNKSKERVLLDEREMKLMDWVDFRKDDSALVRERQNDGMETIKVSIGDL